MFGPRTHKRPPSATPSTGSNLIFDSRQKSARGTEARIERRIDSDARAAFGRAVAFQHARAKLPRPGVGGGFLQFFRAGDEHAQGAEIVRVGLARVAVEEGVGAEKNRAIQIVEQRRDDPVMQRRRIKKNITCRATSGSSMPIKPKL